MKEWIIGRNPVMEVLQAKRRQVFRLLCAAGLEDKGRILELMKMAQSRKIPIETVPREKINALGENPQGVAAEVSGYPYVALNDILDSASRKNEDLFVLVLDVIQNPQNLGTLLRSAEAAGIHGVVIPQHRSAEITTAVVSASSGASEHMLVAQGNLVQSLEEFKKAGAWVVGLEGGEASQPVNEIPLTGPIALVVGNEGEGMRQLVRDSCDFLLALPMKGHIESLNAAVAGSIVIYLTLLEREKKKKQN
ncbi:MAG: 23S rRNA (guanosine(2251)-2'-O)-methyltransferase RlmB [Anaerolineaceae bacterium]|nr:23S rRNA (guanosine(2251)-2'-O)-methyltransferase RlmB [Anaerolineaceae bacterium]